MTSQDAPQQEIPTMAAVYQQYLKCCAKSLAEGLFVMAPEGNPALRAAYFLQFKLYLQEFANNHT